MDFLCKQLSNPDEDDCFEATNNANQETFAAEECNNTDFSVGNYVLVNFKGNLFPGKVIEKKVDFTLFLLWSDRRRVGSSHQSPMPFFMMQKKFYTA